ncbi:hypothetical protein FH972_015598 [Carpinus fangiana]|uniref:Uncharacterized protein n=1 Tax=Carpinus fangiana TaxID=176857 RepID=A0A5N6REE7_9ROSI|nr:hypothetical protein FH972_015598 [Carpinus fangiana]
MDWQENLEDDEDENWLLNWNRRRRMAVAQVLCLVAYAMCMSHVYCHKYLIDRPAASLNSKKRKGSGDDFCMREFEGIRAAIKEVAEAIREGNAIIKKGQARVYSEEEVFSELVNMGVEQNLRYRAYTFLTEDAARVRAFFGCPIDERKKFLLQMMCCPLDP